VLKTQSSSDLKLRLAVIWMLLILLVPPHVHIGRVSEGQVGILKCLCKEEALLDIVALNSTVDVVHISATRWANIR
jgi:hypothetical protein